MIEYIIENLWMFWTVVIFVCLILELSSGDFYITCFAIGGVFGVIAAVLGMPVWLQVFIWALSSVLSIWLIRPRLMKRLYKNVEERLSNADALIGRVGTVVADITPETPGYLKVDGDEWKAVTGDAKDTIRVGEKAKIVSRDSIIVTVEKVIS